MRVPRIGEGEEEGADIRFPDDRENVGQRHIAIVRALVIAAADMQPDAVARHILQGLVDRRDDALDKSEEITERAVLVREVALERQIGAIELQQKAALHDRLVFEFEGRA